MKLSLSTVLATTMSASAVRYSHSSVEFEPIEFLQYETTCDEDKLLYKGQITGVQKIDEGKFCISDVVSAAGGDKDVYSRLDIIKCTEDKVYENWFLCEDKECASCSLEYRAYTSWADVFPEDELEHCYDYQYSTDPATALQRNVLGPLENTISVDYMFGPTANADDVATYRNFIQSNSCKIGRAHV